MIHSIPDNQSATPITTICYDAHEHAENLTNWQQHYDQISGGEFYGEVVERSYDDLQIFKEHTSQALNQHCMVWPDSIWLGIPCESSIIRCNKSSKINGLMLNQQDIMCRTGSTEFELTTPDDFDIFGIVITQKKLTQAAHKQRLELKWQDILNNERLTIPNNTLSAINYLLNRTLDTQTTHTHATPEHLTQDLILMGLLDIFNKETPNKNIDTSYQHRKNIVANARDFLHQHTDHAITLSELCEACHTSRRTLQNSFESILGLSPIQYLRYTRLNGVRRDLKQAFNHETVGDIAARWGFWHLSQFAKDYKILFSEQPKETLRNRK